MPRTPWETKSYTKSDVFDLIDQLDDELDVSREKIESQTINLLDHHVPLSEVETALRKQHG